MTARTPPAAPPPTRIVVTGLSPLVAGGRFPVKRVVGEPVEVAATVFADGHDVLHVAVAHRPPGEEGWLRVPMAATDPGLDRWGATFTPRAEGVHRFRVEARIDGVASWRQASRRKREAGRELSSELLEGAALLEAVTGPAAAEARALADRLRAGDATVVDEDLDGRFPSPDGATASEEVEVLVERELALASAWYELFPRSWSTDPDRRPHGTLADVEAQLGYVADLGFDVLYLPPVHPIGRSHRKGPGNVEGAGPGDPGSPWAIGGPEGGHTAVHPDLGTLDDLRSLLAAARARGLEVALDLAFQASPDHPWVTEHPEWFRHRPDGTIHHAENPPKRYQDIYPFDFEGPAWASLWGALIGVARWWADQGVSIFRVDNPHTKPFAFWERLIAEVRAEHPGTVFLAEAFTRPEVVHRLAQLGFSQSYTYFTWRVAKDELVDYFTELSTPPSVDELRPNAWPNTPDILPWHLQGASREANAARFFLAATLSPSYGIYGPVLELAENEPAGNGKEEYGRSEKYEVRRWDLGAPGSLAPLVAAVNAARRGQAALRTLRTLRFHPTDGPWVLAWSKTPHEGPDPDPARPGANPVLCVANLDTTTQASVAHLDLAALGLDPARPVAAHDLLTGARYRWEGPDQYVLLDPAVQPGHLLRLSQEPRP